MKTKLYRMWIDYCRTLEYMPMATYYIDVDLGMNHTIQNGKVYFNYKRDPIVVKYPSKEYDAWKAFMKAKDPDIIVEWICKNFSMFAEHLPATCIFLELHNMTIDDVLGHWEDFRQHPNMLSYGIMKDFKKALVIDVDNRKNDNK